MSRSTLQQHVKRLILVYNRCQLDVSAGTANICIISLILEFFSAWQWRSSDPGFLTKRPKTS